MTSYRSLFVCISATGITLLLAGYVGADWRLPNDLPNHYVSVQLEQPDDASLPANRQATIELLNELVPPPLRLISISLDPRRDDAAGRLPPNVAHDAFRDAGDEIHFVGASRPWPETFFAWTAPAIPYRPLYFEDENLERYGIHHGLAQPVFSAARFFGRLPAISYMVGATPPHEEQYSLGYYRPGEYTPHFFTLPKWSWRGALLQGGAVVGGNFLIP